MQSERGEVEIEAKLALTSPTVDEFEPFSTNDDD